MLNVLNDQQKSYWVPECPILNRTNFYGTEGKEFQKCRSKWVSLGNLQLTNLLFQDQSGHCTSLFRVHARWFLVCRSFLCMMVDFKGFCRLKSELVQVQARKITQNFQHNMNADFVWFHLCIPITALKSLQKIHREPREFLKRLLLIPKEFKDLHPWSKPSYFLLWWNN